MTRPPTRLDRRSRLAAGALALALAATAVGVGCGAEDPACGPIRREPLDRRSVHVLPGGETTTYETDPPTSGPHLASPDGAPVRTEPLDPAVQVGILEEGGVLLQHQGLDAEEQAALEALASDTVVVAPADELPEGAAVIATAWVTKQVCSEMDVATLERFADDQAGGGPGGHGS